MKTNKITDQDNNINLNKNQIITHRYFNYLAYLNSAMNYTKTLKIDHILDHEEYENMLVPLYHVIYDVLHLPNAFFDLYQILSERIVTIVLFKGELYMFKQDVVQIEKYLESFSEDHIGEDALKIGEDALKNYSINFFRLTNHQKGYYIEADYDLNLGKRSYYLSPEETLKALNIDFFMLNMLINLEILKVVVQDVQVFFYSYQVDEILYVLNRWQYLESNL